MSSGIKGRMQKVLSCWRRTKYSKQLLQESYLSFGSGIRLYHAHAHCQRLLNPADAVLVITRTALTHVGNDGRARMVDVSGKKATRRKAVATGVVRLPKDTFELLKNNRIEKGDVLSVAMVAGVMAAKKCASIIPLCHNIPLDDVNVRLTLDESTHTVLIVSTVATSAATGVEMEALTAVSAAALTVYDMCKGASKNMTIEKIYLVEKMGGKSGYYIA